MLISPFIGQQIHWLDYEPMDSILQVWQAGARLQTNNSGGFKFQLDVHSSLVQQQFTARLNTKIGYDLGKLGLLTGKLNTEQYLPSLLEQQLWLSQENIWKNNFVPTRRLQIGGTYTLPKKWLHLAVTNTTIQNLVYFTAKDIQQQTEALNVFQVQASSCLNWRSIYLDNHIYWQSLSGNDQSLSLPQWIFNHKIYIQGPLFKGGMTAKAGLSINYNSNFYAPEYLPVTGTFSNQRNTVFNQYPSIDAFVAFRIWQFRFFVRAENALQLYYDSNFEPVVDYPYK